MAPHIDRMLGKLLFPPGLHSGDVCGGHGPPHFLPLRTLCDFLLYRPATLGRCSVSSMERLRRAEHIAEHAEVKHPAKRRETRGKSNGVRWLHDTPENAAECMGGTHVARGKNVQPTETAQQHIVCGPRPDAWQLEQPCSCFCVRKRSGLLFDAFERQACEGA